MEVLFKGKKLRIQAYHAGFAANRPSIVFLHEALGSVAQWRDFPQKIADSTGFNVFAYDRLGHGMSDGFLQKRELDYLQIEAWEVLPAMLAQLGIETPIVYGHSDGGSIALLYAARFPTLAVITEAAHVFVEPLTLEGIRDALLRKTFLLERLYRFHGEKTEALFAAWSDTWLAPEFQGWNIESELEQITSPALIIQGREDAYGTMAQVEHIVAGIGEKAAALLIDQCGHSPHREATDAVLTAVQVFLKRVILKF
jgi:pimeloyl-ACP methyl ester carboxylesterase